ncbi:TRAP transporter TatT component family protein [Thiobacillus sedimenti]|uniref:TRAP transporter TatT component family protein n=1 Tax=Thiobacillus sedimenti TaxID=3110231 RepID=A0ABZ1CLG3_9PROT|nr:TRAP transporter TatT component family protein [Thiobacillus sp. SCUT-2]WRS39790.1 TRAP transporter TatT component family protein [Thiobacillus sp. SCUT-2]
MPLRKGWRAPACAALALALLALTGCSTSQLVARGASPLVEQGMVAMNRETDLELARASIPANLKMIEALLLADPQNSGYRVEAAMGFYGYALGFVEPTDPERAAALYRRARDHGLIALERAGLPAAALAGDLGRLDEALGKLDARAVPALFWTASAWAKYIELHLDDPARLDELPRVERMMRRVLALDETYYYGGAHLFFGVYYGARAPMFGGDYVRAARHFDRAAAIGHGRMLLVEVYRARYLLRQTGDRQAFHAVLQRVLDAPEGADPDLNLANALARKEAAALLAKEEELF